MNEQDTGFLHDLFRHPWLIVIVISIITAFFAFQLPKAELDNNNIRFIPDDNEARQISRYIDETFDSSFFILIGLERETGDVFDASFLNRIREFNERMENFEITGNINSIVSSDYIYSVGDTPDESSIVVEKLVADNFSGSQAEISALRQKLLSWEIYRKSLISDDFRATQILIPLTITAEAASRPEVIDSFIEIREIAKEMFSGYASVYVTGLPIISATINEAMRADLMTMIPLVAIVVLLVLFFSFRRIGFVVLPLLTVLVATIWSMGAMPIFGIKLSVISTVLPVILVAVGSAYGIHVVTHYREDMKGLQSNSRDDGSLSSEEHRTLILAMLHRIGKAVTLAAMTTLAGFSSFCFTNVLPIREFGFFSTFGVLVSFLASLTLIPALLIIRGPVKIIKNGAPHSPPFIRKPYSGHSHSEDGIVLFFFRIVQKKGAVLFCIALIFIVSVWGVSKVILDNVFIEYFKTSTDIYRSDRFIREKFGGSKIVSVVAQAENSEILLMPEVLGAMDDLGIYLEEQAPEVGKVLGFTHLVKRINQVFNADESPDGIKPKNQFSGSSSFGTDSFRGDNFGFDSFGFDDFGFDSNIGENNINVPGNEELIQPGEDAFLNEREVFDTAAMMALLREAVSRGKNRSMSADNLVWELEKLVNYEGAAYYEIPRDPKRYGKERPEELQQLVANYLVLLSGNIGSYANDSLSPTAIKTTVQLRTVGNEDNARAVDKIRQYASDHFPPDVNIIIGGSALVEDSLNQLVVQSQIISVIISIAIVFLIITFSYRSLVAGITGIIPLSVCILINFAVMGFAGIKLNIGTSMVASVSVGIGIDYTIHFIEAYKREYLAAKGEGDFILKAFASSGKAILINAVSVGLGFAVLLFSQFIMMKDLGLLIALTMGVSALASLTVIPVILSVFNPKFLRS